MPSLDFREIHKYSDKFETTMQVLGATGITVFSWIYCTTGARSYIERKSKKKKYYYTNTRVFV